jgi:HSP20 family protein
MLLRRLPGSPRWESRTPFKELEQMRKDIDRAFEDLSGRVFRGPIAGVFPLTNVTETGDNFYVRAELPGLKAEELEISVTADSISISGERRISMEEENARYHRREREAGKFSRMISLPSQVDPEKVEARCAEGVLTVVLAKSETAKPKKITVKGSQ